MTQNGSLDIQDVQEKFDELQSWEKKQFLLENIDILDEDDYDTICDNISVEPRDICRRLTPYEVCESFSTRELLDEIGSDDIVDYLSHYVLSVEQIISIVEPTVTYSSDKKNKALKKELLKLIENI
jgi:hypothetical protein